MDKKLEHKLLEAAMLGRRVDNDSLVLSDAVLGGALDGSVPLTGGQRALLQASPLTLRRLRQLANARHAAANDRSWHGSAGMLRAAAGSAPLAQLGTEDGYWQMHFIDGQVVLALAAGAPFAADLMDEAVRVSVRDGAGNLIIQGPLDADGELEAAWPFALAPAEHFQAHGARFTVEPA
ncbi:MAG: hypothetical protein V4463_03285 [Pseudomonadota bacterium]